MNRQSNFQTHTLVQASLFLVLGLLLPFLTGQIPQIGSMLCPMHIPVLLCGYFCGWTYGLSLGFIHALWCATDVPHGGMHEF